MDESQVFAQALKAATPAERVAYLDLACRGRPDLREDVEGLLRAHTSDPDFLEQPADGFGVTVNSDPDRAEPELDKEDLSFLTPSEQKDSLGGLGHYEILEVIGQGGMGTVLRAIDAKLQRVVAIKVMATPLAANATARRRFIREAQAAAAVSHDHIVTIHAVEDSGIRPYLVMYYVAGQSLQQRLNRTGPLQLHEILRIGMQTAAGLAAAHAQGIVHRDIKPANILLENGVERVKITDFGLARAVSDASLTQQGVVAGTPAYMAPEQARGETLDQRADLFSLGSVLYAMCTGRAPFRGGDTIAVLKRVCEEKPPPIREANPQITGELAAVIEKLHAKNPADRYQTAAEVAQILGQQLAHVQHPSIPQLLVTPVAGKQQLESVHVQTRQSHAARFTLWHRWAIAAAALLLLLAGLSLSEAAGVTRLSATVIRILTPDGTLVVETDDPNIKLTVEGDGGVAIEGAGISGVHLRPGPYRVRADKNGQSVPLDQELVTISSRRKQVVRVRLEGAPSVAATTPPIEERGAFVVLGGNGVPERKHDTLAEAVIGASDGDTIEIRGNGPFVCEAISIKGRAHTIRAGAGFQPVLQFSENLTTSGALVLEGLEIQRRGGKHSDDWHGALIFSWDNPTLHIANCRFWDPLNLPIIVTHSRQTVVRNCLFLSPQSLGIAGYLDKLTAIENCLLMGRSGLQLDGFGDGQQPENQARLTHNTWHCISAVGTDANPTAFANATGKPGKWFTAANIFDTSAPFCYIIGLTDTDIASALPETVEAQLRSVLNWRDQVNIYSPGRTSIVANHATGAAGIGPKGLAAWQQFWNSADRDASEGRIRYDGGDLIEKLKAHPEQLTSEDFRLRPDSAGYRAGPDGKDLGADVDLVGPGPAYDRWKKTPEYQQWRKETEPNQKPAAPHSAAENSRADP